MELIQIFTKRIGFFLPFLFTLGEGQAPLRKGPPEWGIYQIYWGFNPYQQQLEKELATFENSKTRPIKYVMFFRDLYRPFPLNTIKYNESKGLVTIISLELTKWSRFRNPKKDYLKDIYEGKYDSYFISWAQEAAQYNKTVIYRFGFEMNGSWFNWGAQPEKFVQAWRHVYSIFKEQGANNIKWMFSPNIIWAEKNFEKDILPYYPGKEYVDLVGLDGYNFGDNYKPYHSWKSYSEVFKKSLDAVQKLSHPIYIAEIGCAQDPRKSHWIQNFLEELESDKRIHGFIWFNFDKREEAELNWRIDSDSASLAAFKNWLFKN